ncbi:ferrous iron transport protein B [Methanolobus mangrovi]|uniref:Ferrous iron transport protein B n=1 Tax=Methanolobus mangrovi TaxID=3072977 RepID=A0AA51YHQ6_9EURY|nr:ferrous iron transport protein B [Methanolobus mangrovi]WMW23401.1 ferrous iron transport protein B [Methanolobus mangrovi]
MEGRDIKIALTGNPNVGKTTLFNALTGSRQHVGNWPGVTVEKKSGRVSYKEYNIEVIDLPGTYSLTAYSMDEIVARDFIIEEKPDIVIQVVDASNLERNLYLTTQLMELGSKILIVLNMCDIAEDRGDRIYIDKMQELLATPVIRTVATQKKGLCDLLDKVIEQKELAQHHGHEIGYGNEIEQKILEIEKVLIEDENRDKRYPLRWVSIRLLEGDNNVRGKIANSPVYAKTMEIIDSIDQEEYEAEIADKRYLAINTVFPQMCTRANDTLTKSDMIDRVLTNKYLGIPIFLALMWGAFELTFAFATPFMDMIDFAASWFGEYVSSTLQPEWLASLVGDGIIGGVGAVLVFVPNIFILFFLLSLLEGSGYLARAAFIMDKLMYKIGMHGKSFIPMLMGFGCNVPAIMAARSIEDEKDRLITILIVPFVSCGARLPIYVLFAGTFFGRQAGTVIFGMYILGIVIAVISAKILRETIVKGKPAPFIMELPPYRVPTLKTSLIHMWDNGFMYIKKAGTIILVGVVVIWILASFPWGVEYGSEGSYVGSLGHAIEPLLKPLGFDWKISVALIFGLVAKEIVVASIGVLYGTGDNSEALSERLLADPGITALSSLSLMAFSLLYMPCVATVGVIKKETGSWKWTIFAIIYGIAVAWITAFIIYQGGKLLGY